FKDPHKRGLTDIRWELYPEGFGALLREMKRYGVPIWVTENGIDDRGGTRRSKFLHAHLQELLHARADGVLVSGCRAGDCWFRFGDTWVEERFRHAREPHLRTHAARARVHVAWAGATDLAALRAELARYRASLRRPAPAPVTEPQPWSAAHD
ncbi:MAG: family 1 glycosylhydrolase, partial [Pseudomonadota bacterium]